MSITIRLSADAGRRLQERADRTGQDLAMLIQALLERQAQLPSFDEILTPLRQDFAKSGMSDDELAEFLSEVRDEVRREKRRTNPA